MISGRDTCATRLALSLHVPGTHGGAERYMAKQREQRTRHVAATFRRILVPTDLGDRTRKALDLALQLAGDARARVTVLHVIETIPGLGFGELRPFYRKLEAKAAARMAAMVRGMGDAAIGVEIIETVTFGPRAESIVSFAAGHNVDLIVLASHRVNPSMVGRDWGTISYKVGILAQCPILLVK